MANNRQDLERLNGAGIIAPIIGNDQLLEPVVNQEFDETIAQEAFMNEMVDVTLGSTTDDNAAPHVTFSVNGRNQTFFRDIEVTVRRCFLEVLARCKETKYTQKTDPFDPTRTEMVPRTVFAYPFTVADRNPKGRAWLAAVKLEAN